RGILVPGHWAARRGKPHRPGELSPPALAALHPHWAVQRRCGPLAVGPGLSTGAPRPGTMAALRLAAGTPHHRYVAAPPRSLRGLTRLPTRSISHRKPRVATAQPGRRGDVRGSRTIPPCRTVYQYRRQDPVQLFHDLTALRRLPS